MLSDRKKFVQALAATIALVWNTNVITLSFKASQPRIIRRGTVKNCNSPFHGTSTTTGNFALCDSRRRRHLGDNKIALHMALIPMLVEEIEESLAVGVPTGEQYTTYWGRTSRERYDAIFEAASVTFLGLFASYFLSFAIGSTIATFLGTIAAFWVLLGPEAKAYQRNWELIGGRRLSDPFLDSDEYDDTDDVDDYDDIRFDKSRDNEARGLFGAYFVSSVEKVAVVDSSTSPESEEYDLDDFQDYTMEKDEHELEFGTPYLLRLVLSDRSGRTMQVHGRMSEKYINIMEGMLCVNILLSADPNFRVLAGLTDFYIPDANCFVGDYPYLNKFSILREMEENEELARVLDDEDRTNENWGNIDEKNYEELSTDENSSRKGRKRKQQSK